MNKRSQFFLIAAVVIVSLIIGFGSISISSYVKKDDKKPYRLADEMISELGKTVDYAVNHDLTEAHTISLLENLSELYQKENPSYEIGVIYLGDNLTGTAYKFESGLIVKNNLSVNQNSTSIFFINNNINYSFDIKKGKNIHVIVNKLQDEEKVVVVK